MVFCNRHVIPICSRLNRHFIIGVSRTVAFCSRTVVAAAGKQFIYRSVAWTAWYQHGDSRCTAVVRAGETFRAGGSERIIDNV